MPDVSKPPSLTRAGALLAAPLSFALISSILALAYVPLAWVVPPWPHLNILLLSLCWAVMTCRIAGFLIRSPRARPPVRAGILAVLGSLVGYYVSLAVWIYWLSPSYSQDYITFFDLNYSLLNPLDVLGYVKTLVSQREFFVVNNYSGRIFGIFIEIGFLIYVALIFLYSYYKAAAPSSEEKK